MQDPAYRLEIAVRLRDLDGVGHVNNAVTIAYLEDARNSYLMAERGLTRLEEVDFILARTEIDYRSPAHLGERLEVLLRPTRIGSKSFDLEYEIRELTGARVIAQARTVVVSYDFAARRTIAIPPALRALLERDLRAS
ncbi:MAG: thioesterase family protein [Planctomycetota bacterium]